MSLLDHDRHNLPDPRIVSVLSFLAGIVSILVIQGTMQQFRAETTYGDTAHTPNYRTEKSFFCQNNRDCTSPIQVCDTELAKCVDLPEPRVGQCTQAQVLTYTTKGSHRAKHTFCSNRCAITPQGARCI